MWQRRVWYCLVEELIAIKKFSWLEIEKLVWGNAYKGKWVIPKSSTKIFS